MSKQVRIKRKEVTDLITRVQRLTVLKTISRVVSENPDRVGDFGFNINAFSNINSDINMAQEYCNQWWHSMADQYNLPHNATFSVGYNSNIITIED